MRTRVWWAGLMALAMVLGTSPAMANHAGNDDTGQYAFNPIEHDDQGRSHEPDGLSSGVFGFPLTNAVIDRDFNGYADVPTPGPIFPGKGPFIAPGCTDENDNRVQSGQCGLWTIGAGLGQTGIIIPKETLDLPIVVKSGSCPGRFADRPVAMLDSRVDFALAAPSIPSQWYNLNHKMADADTALGGILSSLGVSDTLAGPVAHWAWYGVFEDKNCNGVIDHVPFDEDDPSLVNPKNEFIWHGSCTDFDGAFQPDVIQGQYCREDPNPNSNPPGRAGGDARTTMYWYIWPGLHTPSFAPDFPPPWNWLEGDGDEEWDLAGSDRTGERQHSSRLWMGGLGFPQWYYDQSAIFTVDVVTSVNCKPRPDLTQLFELGATGGVGSPCTFVDVDRYESWNPLVESLLSPIKGTTNEVWNTVVEQIPSLDDQGPISRLLNQILGKSFYDSTGGPQQGLVQDLAVHPGWGREPNVGPVTLPTGEVVRDRYVDVVNTGACDKNPGLDDRDELLNGWCNVNTKGASSAYAAYQGDDFRGWFDVRPEQVLAWITPIRATEGGQCIQCLSIVQMVPIITNPVPGGNPADPDDRTLTIGPGQWLFSGHMGRWKDIEHHEDESVFPQSSAEVPCVEDPGQAQCVTYARDGWIGFLSGGSQEYEGYLPQECGTEQGFALHAWRVCNPYLDGNVDDPQCLYTALDPEDPEDCQNEWQNACQLSSTNVVEVYPADGQWDIPLIVWNSWKNGMTLIGDQVADYTLILPGDTTHVPVRLRMEQCTEGYEFRTVDHLIMPVGNAGEDLVTVVRDVGIGVSVAGAAQQDIITDVDVYGGAVV